MTVASTILAQLGGKRFLAMTGAHNLLDCGDSLSMHLRPAETKDRATALRVTLLANDTYQIDLLKFNRKNLELKVLAQVSDVYVENLRQVFTTLTGLQTSL